MLQSLSTGAVKTEFINAAGHHDLDPEKLNKIPWLESKDTGRRWAVYSRNATTRPGVNQFETGNIRSPYA